MISRRQIRVKVLQTLYTLAADKGDAEPGRQAAAKILNDKLEHTLDLFTLAVLYTLRTAQYAETDAQLRSGKYLPNAEDLNVSTRIAGNSFLHRVLANETFQQRAKDKHLQGRINEEQVRKFYQQLAASEGYKAYAYGAPKNEENNERNIIRYTWTSILNGENGASFFRDEVPGWEEDEDIIRMLMENFFKNPDVNFLQILPSKDKRDFAFDLLDACLDKEAYLMELIRPKLANWEAERVAMVDMVLLRMGVAELLYFPTIPTKVTINEYIDIAKQYSTPQSGQFVNGILDALLRDFTEQGVVNKPERYIKNNPRA